jgi:flagellar biosynthesis protein FliP
MYIIIIIRRKKIEKKLEKIYKTIEDKNFRSRNHDISVLVFLVLLLLHPVLVLYLSSSTVIVSPCG